MFKSTGIQLWIVFLGVLLTFSCPLAFAQVQTGEILGVVTDATGAAVPGATVTITNVGTNSAREIKADEQGRYDASDLSIGNYQIEVQMQGFAVQTQTGLVLAIGQKLVADFKLQVGSVAQQVTVNTSLEQINTTTSEVGGLVNGQQMQDLPLNGRDYEQLFSLTPGVAQNQVAQSGANFGATIRFSAAGARPNFGSVLLDGIEIRSFWGAGAGLAIMGTSLGVDGIAEFQALTSDFTAQYHGDFVLNSVTRSGTNDFHGSAYGFFRNSAMDARNYFDPASGPPAFHRNQFGGALGGPIKKNKTFFFVNYEGLRAALALTNTEDVPNANAHNGFLPCSQAQNVTCNTSTGLANVGVNPLMVPYLALYPVVTGNPGVTALVNGTDQFTQYAQQPQSENYIAGKVDYQISENDTIAFRYVLDHGLEVNPWPNGGNPVPPGENSILPNFEVNPEQNQYLTIQDRHILSASLVNVATVSFVRTNQEETDDLSKAPAIMTFIPGRVMGSIAISNVASTGPSSYLPLHWLQNNFTEGDEIDWVHGAHTLKFGGTITRIQCNCQQAASPGGAYTFSASTGGPSSGLESFLQDSPSLLQGPTVGGTNAERNDRETVIGGYVQDDLKATKQLTINLGFRYDFVTNPTDASGLLYRITNLYPVIPNYPLESTGYTHESHYFQTNPSTRNLDPRVGFAWDIFGDQKTSLRGGFGIYHSILYPRSYTPGGSYAFPQVQGLQHNPTFPNALKGGLAAAPTIARTQEAWDYRFTPEMFEYNLTLERQLPWGMAGSLGYIGSGGEHLIVNDELNSNLAEILPGGVQYRPPCGSIAGTSYGCTPNTNFGPIEVQTPAGNSHYNGMILSVKRNIGKGIQLQSGFTWARSIDFGSNDLDEGDTPNDSFSWLPQPLPYSYNKGPSAFNVGKNWTSNALIPLPFGQGNQLREGWQLSTITTWKTGSPITPTAGTTSFDVANLGQFDYAGERPNPNPSFTGRRYPHTVTQWFNPAAYMLPATGYIGFVGRNSITGPGLFDSDVSIMKGTRISKLGEGASLEIRGDFFNVFNHANFSEPVASVYTSATVSPSAGAITKTSTTSRQLQFSSKLVF